MSRDTTTILRLEGKTLFSAPVNDDGTVDETAYKEVDFSIDDEKTKDLMNIRDCMIYATRGNL
jgi:hypothetical protein